MDYNPFAPEVQENPYPYYAYLRQHAPVYQVPGVGFWAVTRYDDVLYVLKNPHLFSSSSFFASMSGELDPFPSEAPAIIAHDPPAHTRLRKLVNRAFTPRRVASLESRTREITSHLVEQMVRKRECELVMDLANPLPVVVIAELLGVEADRRADFKRWSDDVVRAFNGAAVTPEQRAQIRQSITALHTYLHTAIETCRRQPSDNLISDLVRAEEENQKLTADEILSLALIILLGGNETTTNLIGNAMLALLAHPEEWAKVQTNPALIPTLVEEAVRYDAPVQWFPRQTTQEVELAGTTLPAGAVVMVLYGSANRDERKFPDPDRFDILRNTDGHMGFGFGVHFCLGALLARLEAKVVLEMLLERSPRLSRTDIPITRVENPAVRGPKTLRLVVG